MIFLMKLQEELKRPAPYTSLQQETLVNLLRAGDQIENRLSRLFREHGLTLSRFNVLRSLALANRPLTCGEIGERMIQVVPAITSLVDRLEKHALVERHRCLEDRRVVHVSITQKGRQLSDAVDPSLRAMEESLLKSLTQAELKTLLGLLEKTRESLSASEY
ncbi:HTH-type transcriptional regulator MhqR [Allorhodopirellula solitaria]|uniref:HTH-type transcriptional regulator MhqR n=2 Tax=Allorhodopirellula solitaria TaxID=2527987 RepID=A0A5C5YHN2_9BACT|nr:HTH-type transcriptional regulator MhqR [Allorhodopirellula solitaria]